MEEQIVSNAWSLYERGKNYNRMQRLYEEGIDNYDFYHGRQWERLERPNKTSKAYTEPVVLNVVKPIVKYKVNIVNQNSYQIIFNPNTYNTREELEMLKSTTKGLTQFVNRMWEKSQTGKKVRSVVKNACINSEGIIYFYNKDEDIVSEEIDKNNIYYGNENEQDIQQQPYILTIQRKPVEEVRRLARQYKEAGENNLTEEEIENIVSDKDFWEQPGREKRIDEIVPMCLIIKMFKRDDDGKVWVSESTKGYEILRPQSTECELYPFAHFVWEEEKGYARGVSEVTGLIENQKEINKVATRRAIAVKISAFPKLVVNSENISNMEALNQVGSPIEVTEMRADDVRKVVNYLTPTSMSQDAYNLQQDLISGTRELAGAGDTVTGQIDPTQASGKAILAVQQASQQPLNEQIESYKYFLEDCARIVLEQIKVYFINGLTLYASEDVANEMGQTETIETPFKISQEDLEKLDINMKIDITRTSPYDTYAREMSLLELFTSGHITLEEYTEALSDESTMPKDKLEVIVRRRKEARQMISEMQAQVNAIDGAINQEMIRQGGDMNAMSEMPIGGDASGASTEQQSLPQM
jgi:hypothetical protein